MRKTTTWFGGALFGGAAMLAGCAADAPADAQSNAAEVNTSVDVESAPCDVSQHACGLTANRPSRRIVVQYPGFSACGLGVQTMLVHSPERLQALADGLSVAFHLPGDPRDGELFPIRISSDSDFELYVDLSKESLYQAHLDVKTKSGETFASLFAHALGREDHALITAAPCRAAP